MRSLKKIEKVHVVGKDETIGEYTGTIIRKKTKSFVVIRDDNGQEQVAYRSMCTIMGGDHYARVNEDGSLQLPVKPEISDEEIAAYEEEKKKAAHLNPDHTRYTETMVDGKKKYDIGDSVAEYLRDFELEEVYDVAYDLNLGDLKPRYEHLNPGMQRMNLGNRIRKVVTEGGYGTVKEAITGIGKMLETNQLVEGQGFKQIKAPKPEQTEANDKAEASKEKAPKEGKKGKKSKK